MSRSNFRVLLSKEALTFSAAHFITFNGNICESLHGHNYRVQCEVSGELDVNGYVIDFIALRDRLAELVREWDHHVLLPTKHPLIKVVSVGAEVIATFENKRWVFPVEDCVLLPIANTTAELLAWQVGQRLMESKTLFGDKVTGIQVMVDENLGQWGCWSGKIK